MNKDEHRDYTPIQVLFLVLIVAFALYFTSNINRGKLSLIRITRSDLSLEVAKGEVLEVLLNNQYYDQSEMILKNQGEDKLSVGDLIFKYELAMHPLSGEDLLPLNFEIICTKGFLWTCKTQPASRG
jgi:hypothetical protein